MDDESILRERARALLRAGKLPSRSPDAMWGGPGDNAGCGVCGALVTPADIEMEIEFVSPDGGSETYHLHGRCMAAWELERQRFEPTRTAPAANGHTHAAPGSDFPSEAAS
jgi:hypothetical protein